MQYSQIINQNVPVIIDFHALWCGPCKMMAPMMEQIKEEYQDKIKIYKIDIDKNRGLAEQHQIQAVPTLIIYKNGKIMWRVAGVPSQAELKSQINLALENQ